MGIFSQSSTTTCKPSFIYPLLTAPGLRKLVDRVLKNVDALEALGKTEAYYAGAVTSVIMESIPQEIALSLRKELRADIKDASRLISALSRDVMEREKTSRKLNSRIRSPSPTQYQPTAATFFTNSHNLCLFCGKDHPPQACTKVSSPATRASITRKQGRCFNCLKKGHIGRQCRSLEKCHRCRGKHHTALCREGDSGIKPAIKKSQGAGGGSQQQKRESQQRVGMTTPEAQDATPTTNTLLAASKSQVLLQTARMKLSQPGTNTTYKEVRAVLDTGSQRTYISEDVARNLQLSTKDTKTMKIQTFREEALTVD